jgi:aminocarboxymuconate-semialdehyde decarboxylase
VEIGNHVGDRDIDDPGTVEFLQHCASLGVPVFVHPWDMAASPRTTRWMAQWLVALPGKTHLSMKELVDNNQPKAKDLRMIAARA